MKTSSRNPNWHLSPDMLFLIGPGMIGMVVAFLYSQFVQAKWGVPSIFYVAAFLGAVGIVLLFFAKLPLYRQRRFFTFGSVALDRKHRWLYRAAYVFVYTSVALLLVLLLLLILVLR